MSGLVSPRDIVKSGLCIGCGSCVAQALTEDISVRMKFDAHGELKPEGPQEWFERATEQFTATCPFSPMAKNEDDLSSVLFPAAPKHSSAIGRTQSNFVGHVAEQDFRINGSSGGMVTWVATELMRRGLIDGVAHVIATENPNEEGRFFKYRISRTEEEIRQGAKSRYYPVELSTVVDTIKNTPGRYAVVAVPCMIKAIQLLRQEDDILHDRIRFTLGLFCGHMKSARFAESFALQLNVPIERVEQVEYRYKYPDRPANWYNAMLKLDDGRMLNQDWWHLKDGDWGAGFFMNSACNFCDDVVAETADISFGDAWVEPYSSDGKGTNVVVVRSPLIEQIVSEAIQTQRLQLQEVDNEFIENTQAAGLRQRREGLAYRLTWAAKGIQPVKRVKADAKRPAPDRKRIYRVRFNISKWSHKFFWLSRKMGVPAIYLGWARLVAAFYHGVAYHQGKKSEMMTRFKQLGE
ncbi:coenzyme F420 hydrogenase [Mucilaginibacter terrenus]|uniref:Coenzyme F420 hydrogenase n=1 Tax=Mucilaginibacter terrenus TaxID=2482727 RepID=A0A3E2NP48_9SPHI|nr:Coenzyme F420 hydrogenase/dehydrogenase, beta subunit C-terminal domain [Mucilaginibacter terrenus]RFZ82779.1 coenzyme F420 hydrogenase [Mucilaginibacter terrenus]